MDTGGLLNCTMYISTSLDKWHHILAFQKKLRYREEHTRPLCLVGVLWHFSAVNG